MEHRAPTGAFKQNGWLGLKREDKINGRKSAENREFIKNKGVQARPIGGETGRSSRLLIQRAWRTMQKRAKFMQKVLAF
jgi:hypothetical protein